MTATENLKAQAEKLICEAFAIVGRDPEGNPKTGFTMRNEAAEGWLVATASVIDLICPTGKSPYRQWASQTKASLMTQPRPNYTRALLEGREVLRRLVDEIEAGLLVNIANQAAAETFDTFLDHGLHYLASGQKNEGGVIVGVVFEDTVRRICRLKGISENGVKLDELVSQLVKANVITPLKAKRARAAAALRTSAAHARWEEFTDSDVEPVADLTRELLSEYLDKAAS